MQTRVIAYPSPPIPRPSPVSHLLALFSPVLLRVSSPRGEARCDRWRVALGAPGGSSRGRSTKTPFVFPTLPVGRATIPLLRLNDEACLIDHQMPMEARLYPPLHMQEAPQMGSE